MAWLAGAPLAGATTLTSVPTARTLVAHQGHTATLLDSGRVLVVGSTFPFDVHATELYDADLDRWTRVGGTREPRNRHGAVLLRNGRVLVAGGYVNFASTASAEIYDPVAQVWHDAAPMAAARAETRMVVLADGRVLAAGGSDGNYTGIARSEIYDASSNRWTEARAMAAPRAQHVLARLADGRVLAAGGQFAATAEIYDPATDAWAPVAAMAVARRLATATVLLDGRVLVVGGQDRDTKLDSAEIYDPQANRWTTTTRLHHARVGHTATLMPDGRVLVVSGANGFAVDTSAEIFDPASGAWTDEGSLRFNRSEHTATLLADGRVLLAGGGEMTGERVDTARAPWTAAVDTGPQLTWHALTTLPDGRVLVTGGIRPDGEKNLRTFLYDPASGAWSEGAPLPAEFYGHTATLLADGRVLLAGALSGPGGGPTFLYDPAANTWTFSGNLAVSRVQQCGVLLADGRVLVAGGPNGSKLAEVYDPAANAWSTGGTMQVSRVRATCTLLADGRVLMAGGYELHPSGQQVDLASVEIFQPEAGTWRAAAPMALARYDAQSVRLPDGSVLVVGGDVAAGGARRCCEIYDVRTDTWTTVGDVEPAVTYHRAIVLASGAVVRIGGAPDYGVVARFDPATGRWVDTARLAESRTMFEAVALADGGVLVVGGMKADWSDKAHTERLRPPAPPPARRPQVTGVTSPLLLPGALDAWGSGFIGRSEAAGGNSASHAPVVRVQRLDNGPVVPLPPGMAPVAAEHFTSASVSDLAQGWYRLTVTVDGIPGDGGTFAVRNTPAAPASTVQFAKAGYAVEEGAGAVTVMAMRTGDCTRGAGVRVEAVNGTAVAGRDFVLPPQSAIAWDPGECFPKRLSIPVVDNAVSDGNRRFELRLVAPVNATLGTRPGAVVDLLDDESAPLRMPRSVKIVANPFGPLVVEGATQNGNLLTGLGKRVTIELGPDWMPNQALELDLDGFAIGPGNRLVLRAGASDQVVLLRNVDPTLQASIEGAVVAEGNGAFLPPKLHLNDARGVAILESGRVLAPGGLLLDGLAGDWNTGGDVVNEGLADGGTAGLQVMGGGIHGGGFFQGAVVLLSTFGNANNPVNGQRYLANGLNVLPANGRDVVVEFNGYGPRPQFFNVQVHGNAEVNMPSYSYRFLEVPRNNLPAPGALDPPYGGGSLIVQASGALTLGPWAGYDFVFPGGLVFKAGGRLDVAGVGIRNGWTASGRSFQGMFFESPYIVNDNHNGYDLYLVTNSLNWINFSTVPQAPLQAAQVVGSGVGYSTVDASLTAPHVNPYSVLIETAAAGGCWQCLMNMAPVNLQ